MSILKMSAVSEVPRDRILAMFFIRWPLQRLITAH